MSKAKATRANIIQQAAELFNQKGYSGSSMADIMRATGLQKGGIYNHFKSKDELALEAFDYAYQLVSQRIWEAIRTKSHALEKLKALVLVYLNYIDDPPLAGGCPVLNTAIESDDAHPALRDRARQAMTSWRNLIIRIVNKGINKGEIASDVEAEVIATILISTIEGAIMMSKLYQDPIYLERAVSHLNNYIETISP
ncbi:TetR/AcrR family transcriptional regulator [Pleurocapsales cyanobacterium LEGE 06147]|nr:TetR/AcrR family transcriptional regulator [Pleurocapsales cyanobacterium LEGE 06147]